MDAKPTVEAPPLTSEEVTASHGIWFTKGDEDDYELDRRWPTVPRVEGLSKRLVPFTIDLSLLLYAGIVVGAVLLLT